MDGDLVDSREIANPVMRRGGSFLTRTEDDTCNCCSTSLPAHGNAVCLQRFLHGTMTNAKTRTDRLLAPQEKVKEKEREEEGRKGEPRNRREYKEQDSNQDWHNGNVYTTRLIFTCKQ